MAKIKPIFNIESYGIYENWKSRTKVMPTIKQCTTLIPAEVDIEFGLTMRAKHAKGVNLTWCIQHPNISDECGQLMPAFEGDIYVRNNDWTFYLGDTIWLPLADKVGIWSMFIMHNEIVVANKNFEITLDDIETQEQNQFWKRRGF